MSNDFISLFLIVLLLGIRHGLDLDHIAAIDAITRNVSEQKKLARIVGVLFSVGHGSVVITLSIIIGFSMQLFTASHRLWLFMELLSILFLLSFSLVNFYWAFHKASVNRPTQLIASKVLKNIHHPFSIVCIGGIFAISFDTITQIAYFSVQGTTHYGIATTLLFGFIFMLGMILIDGMNGFLMSYLVRRADRASQFISRLLSVGIGTFGFAMSICGISNIIFGD